MNSSILKHRSVKHEQLISLYNLMIENRDFDNASKLMDLYEKLNNKEHYFGFTGHFSAGKSSMINELLEEDILPKSPIPTSGNIVEITSNIDHAQVFFNDNTYETYPMPYDADKIKEYCTDNVSIQKVTLGTMNQSIPKGNIILDTPGIDAANDVDRLITESSLHLIDHLFYVTDYNHVQSDVNLTFLKQIQEKGIPFSLIINQIDKHNEEEITFEQFKGSVDQTFTEWGITPEKKYYTSLFEPMMEHNQFNELRRYFFKAMQDKTVNGSEMNSSVQQVINDHKQFLSMEKETILNELPIADDTISDYKLVQVEQSLEQLEQKHQLLEQEFQSTLSDTLKNAYLMPATLRDKARSFLESEQEAFKVGFFQSKRKTAIEKADRLNEFLTELQQMIESTIAWKLRDKIMELLSTYDVSTPKLMGETKDFSITYTEENLRLLVNKGARISGEYVLNYTNDVTTDIKNKFRSKARSLWKIIQKELKIKLDSEIEENKKQLSQLKSAHEQHKEFKIIEKSFEIKCDRLDDQFENPTITEHDHNLFGIAIENKAKQYKKRKESFKVTKSQLEEKVVSHHKDNSSNIRNIKHEQMIDIIDQTVEAVERLPMFQTLINDLQQKRSRLTNRQLTIALFGAFSAGKSSFANALMGNNVLPSTPHPTTAVINKIAPTTNDYPHGTVSVKVKEEREIVADIIDITKEFSPPINADLAALIDWIEKNKVIKNNQLNKTYIAYLQSLISGYGQFKNALNKEMIITLSEFATYVADETKACYVESITLYYDCSLTEMGITLVDTPGADSMNARHTNVAFNYVKKADAILYVTYYNHALSRADKDFLTQLGNVKDAFELDKMFFIINASDLAVDEQELQLVINYVQQQLISLGIRFPKIYPVSSKQSLEEKLSNNKINKQINTFETDFYKFIQEDLIQLVLQASITDVERVGRSLTNFIQSTTLNEHEKKEKENKLLSTQKELQRTINQGTNEVYEERISQRIERQIFFLEDRMAIRFHDLFKDVFNPTTLNASGRKLTDQFNSCLNNIIQLTSMELLREVQAICIRIEALLRELYVESQNDYKEKCLQIDQQFIIPFTDMAELEVPSLELAFGNISDQDFPTIKKQFKGTKAFFQNNDREEIRDAFYQQLSTSLSEYLSNVSDLMESSYLSQWRFIFTNNKQELIQVIDEYTENHLEMMKTTVDIVDLKNKQQLVTSLI